MQIRSCTVSICVIPWNTTQFMTSYHIYEFTLQFMTSYHIYANARIMHHGIVIWDNDEWRHEFMGVSSFMNHEWPGEEMWVLTLSAHLEGE